MCMQSKRQFSSKSNTFIEYFSIRFKKGFGSVQFKLEVNRNEKYTWIEAFALNRNGEASECNIFYFNEHGAQGVTQKHINLFRWCKKKKSEFFSPLNETQMRMWAFVVLCDFIEIVFATYSIYIINQRLKWRKKCEALILCVFRVFRASFSVNTIWICCALIADSTQSALIEPAHWTQ